MAKNVLVSAAQRDAARMIVSRSAAQGKAVSPAVQKIAKAEPIAVTVSTGMRVRTPKVGKIGPIGGGRSIRKLPSKGLKITKKGRSLPSLGLRRGTAQTESRSAKPSVRVED